MPLRARLSLILVGLAWVLPFLSPNFFAPISSFYGETTAFVLGLAALTVLSGKSTWPEIRLPRTSLMFLGFAALVLLDVALGRDVYVQTNLLAVLYLVWAVAMAALAWRLREIFGLEALVTALSWFVIAGALTSAVIGVLQLWGIPSLLTPFIVPQAHGRIYANTGQPNHFADYLCLGIASLGFLYASGRIRMGLVIAAVLPSLVVLAESGSRAVWLYLPALLFLALVHRKLRPSPAASRLLWFGASVVVAFVIAQVIVESLAGSTVLQMETVTDRLFAAKADPDVRSRLWYECWLMFKDAPVLGQGFRQFPWQHFLRNAQLPYQWMGEVQYDNGHNLVLHLMAEFGLAGIAVLAAGIACWLAGIRKQQISPPMLWTMSVAVILGIHSMLEYPLWYAYFLGIAAVLMGATDSAAVRIGGRRILILVVLLGWVAAANTYQDYRTLQSLHRIQTPSAGTDGRSTTEILLGLQQHSLFTPYVELALSRTIALNREQIEDKLVVNEAVMHFAPSADVVYRHAALLALDGQAGAAHRQWDLAQANYRGAGEGIIGVLEKASASEPGIAELLAYANAQQDRGTK
ncbi:MAG TPA: Wzy polymerase domain-containing protein [Burkholderiales bacterium]|nr:Wzy polymerase domain-containing protein [Burkholderiales bacterium]